MRQCLPEFHRYRLLLAGKYFWQFLLGSIAIRLPLDCSGLPESGFLQFQWRGAFWWWLLQMGRLLALRHDIPQSNVAVRIAQAESGEPAGFPDSGS